MATLVFDKKGKEFKVTHKIDVQGWLDAGYTLKKEKSEKDLKGEPMTQEEFDQVKDGLKSLNASEIQRVAEFLEVDYTNKKETLAAIEASLANDL